jgi:hypothetical protein
MLRSNLHYSWNPRTIQRLEEKKKSHMLKGDILLKWAKKSQLICPETSACCSCDLYSRCAVWFPHFSTQLLALCRTEVRTLPKIPVFIWISWQAFSSRYSNTSTLLIPTAKIQRTEFRWSWRPVDWASASSPLFTETLVQVLSDNEKKMGVSSSCKNPRVVVDKEDHIVGVGLNHSPKKWCTAHVSLLHKTICPKMLNT